MLDFFKGRLEDKRGEKGELAWAQGHCTLGLAYLWLTRKKIATCLSYVSHTPSSIARHSSLLAPIPHLVFKTLSSAVASVLWYPACKGGCRKMLHVFSAPLKCRHCRIIWRINLAMRKRRPKTSWERKWGYKPFREESLKMRIPPAKTAESKCKTSSINSFIWRGTLCTERPNGSFRTQVWTGNIFLPVIPLPPQYLASIPYGCTFWCWFLFWCTREHPETSFSLTLSPKIIYNYFFSNLCKW